MQVAQGHALLEDVDHDRACGKQLGLNLLLVVIVGADGENERSWRDVFTADEPPTRWRARHPDIAPPSSTPKRASRPDVEVEVTRKLGRVGLRLAEIDIEREHAADGSHTHERAKLTPRLLATAAHGHDGRMASSEGKRRHGAGGRRANARDLGG